MQGLNNNLDILKIPVKMKSYFGVLLWVGSALKYLAIR